MVDIQSSTTEIRRGKKRKKEEETAGQKYNGVPYSTGAIKTRRNNHKIYHTINLG